MRVARAVAVGVVRRGGRAAGGRTPRQRPGRVGVGAGSGAAGVAAVMVNHGGRRGRRELEHGARRRRGGAAARRGGRTAVRRCGNAQRRTPGRRVIGRGRRAAAGRRLVVVSRGVRERVYVTEVTADGGPRLVGGRLGAGRAPARLMVVRDGRRGQLRRLLRVGRGGTAATAGHVHGRLGPRRAQCEIRRHAFRERRLGRSDFAGRVGAAERAHGTAVRRHGDNGRAAREQQVDRRRRRQNNVRSTADDASATTAAATARAIADGAVRARGHRRGPNQTCAIDDVRYSLNRLGAKNKTNLFKFIYLSVFFSSIALPIPPICNETTSESRPRRRTIDGARPEDVLFYVHVYD